MFVTDARAVRVLTDPAELRFFAPFIAQDRTVAEVALETGAKPNTMFVKVKKYLSVGLLRVVAERSRGGRAIRVYRSSADTLFIPHAHAGDVEENSLKWYGFWDREAIRWVAEVQQREWPEGGFRIYRDEHGVFNSNWARSPDADEHFLDSDAPALFHLLHDGVFLDFRAAKALQRELRSLIERYTYQGGAQRYLVRVQLTPMLEGAAYIP